MMLEPGESEDELVYGEEPANNGDYTWCENCKAYVHLDYTKPDPNADGEYLHRGHRL
jgi:hypothetical protein